jgi:hypothetical protein
MAFKETRRYCNFKEETPNGTLWRTGFAKECGPVIRDCRMNE